jgi:hypothetical protein
MEVSLKVTRQVAEKIYKNLHKGMPPLKPDRGEHGGCSWALHSGEPYVGRLTDRVVPLTVTVADPFVNQSEYPATKLKKTQGEYDCLLNNKLAFMLRENPEARPQVVQAKTWDGVGEHLRHSHKAMLLYVPKGFMSRGAGHFMVIPPAASPHVTVSDEAQTDLLACILRWNSNFSTTLGRADIDKEGRGKDLAVTLSTPNAQDLPARWITLLTKIPAPASTNAQAVQTVAPKAIGGWVTGKSLAGQGSSNQTKTLVFATYREARVAFKTLRGLQLRPADGLSLTVAAPADWPDKLKKLYSER